MRLKKRNMYSGRTNIEEVEYYYSIIDKHIRNLDFELITFFSRVHEDLKLVIEKYDTRWNTYINLNFTSSPSSGGFNFEAYDKFIINKKL